MVCLRRPSLDKKGENHLPRNVRAQSHHWDKSICVKAGVLELVVNSEHRAVRPWLLLDLFAVGVHDCAVRNGTRRPIVAHGTGGDSLGESSR